MLYNLAAQYEKINCFGYILEIQNMSLLLNSSLKTKKKKISVQFTNLVKGEFYFDKCVTKNKNKLIMMWF